MGCDIHLFVEVNKNSKWESVDEWIEEDGRKRVAYEDRFSPNRNYDLFAILANVRNGYGFAGCDTGDGFVPISTPRGIPDNVSFLVKDEADNWNGDGHSHSWLTLAELLSFDWTQTTTKRGCVDAVEYRRWARWRKQRGEGPRSWSGGVSGSMTQIVTEQEMCRRLKEIDPDGGATDETIGKRLGRYYCFIEWATPYYVAASEFWCYTIPQMLRMGKPEDVRIVFWFDN